ncbi:MAG: hypothetical protein DMG15_20195 [Acidobacteria bacterium]|nr:MAG: hypothetical protein DMG16_08055 [Acidobacteriota bacterium]PYS10694.1 MAG: hypothetical protein DMG15_20195 [Acidobacteriota bacterium]
MNICLLAFLLLQSSLLLPPRGSAVNPAAVSQVPAKLQKDYDKLWSRFVSGQSDAQLMKDIANFMKKQKNFDPVLTIDAYIELYKGNDAEAARKFQQAFAINSKNWIAAYYLAELAYTHQDYGQANTFYSLLLDLDKSRTDVEPKREKALLLATEKLLRSAAQAEADDRFSDAEQLYRQALNIAPKDPALHSRLADLLAKAGKQAESAAERKIAEELTPRRASILRSEAGSKDDDLEDLGRWGNDIERLHEIRDAQNVSREQIAALIVKYFPQVVEHRQNQQIVTDIDSSWAREEIQIAVDAGLMSIFPNHTYEPSAAISRGEFAAPMARLIRLLGLAASANPPISITDMAPTNAQYADVQLVLGYGLMNIQDSGVFDVSAELSGREAVRAAAHLLQTFQQAQH